MTNEQRPEEKTRRRRPPRKKKHLSSERSQEKGLLPKEAHKPQERKPTHPRHPSTHHQDRKSSLPHAERTHSERQSSSTSMEKRHHDARSSSNKRPRRKPGQETTSAPSHERREEISLDRIRVIPMGGVEEVGRNMIIIEIGYDIFVCDLGFQFVPEADAPGVDYCLPNTLYLEERKRHIKGVFITHAHLDHIGGVPFIMERIGNPPIYTKPLTAMLLKKRQEEYPDKPKLDIRLMEDNNRVRVGSTYVSTFPVTHSIPDSMGLKIETFFGNILISGDLKLDHNQSVPTREEQENFGRLGKENNLLLIADSTNAERPGFSITEREVQENLAQIIRSTKGRLIIGTFASQFSRMIKIITVARECGKKVVLEGRSIKTNIEIALLSGLLDVPKDTIISASESKNYPNHQVLIVATGAQGEEYAALNRMALKSHKDIALDSSDTVLFSSSVIPGNEIDVQNLKDRLYRYGLKIVHYKTSDVHSTGHGNAGEMVWINQQIKPKYFLPGYGFRSMTHAHAEAVIEAGFPRNHVVLAENGTIVDLTGGQLKVLEHKIPADMMIVDGNTVGVLPAELLKDRQSLSSGGIVVAALTVNKKTAVVMKAPDLAARGFIPDQDFKKIMHQASSFAQKVYSRSPKGKGMKRYEEAKDEVQSQLSKFLSQKTGKNPVVIAVVVEIG